MTNYRKTRFSRTLIHNAILFINTSTALACYELPSVSCNFFRLSFFLFQEMFYFIFLLCFTTEIEMLSIYHSVAVHVAFSTRLSQNTRLTNSPTKSDKVDLNIGAGYSMATGKHSASVL